MVVAVVAVCSGSCGVCRGSCGVCSILQLW